MGEGNWSPRGGVTVILEEDIENPLWYEDFLDNLHGHLSVAWSPVKDTWYGNNSKVQFESGLHRIITHADSYGHMYVCFIPRPDLDRPALAEANTEKWAQTLFDKLQQNYPEMRVAYCAWTSVPRLTQEQRILARTEL